MTQNRNIFGVTGLSGSGTSTVSNILGEMGGVVISADVLAHQAMAESGTTREITAIFGDNILTKGQIDRKTLGNIVFRDREKLALLEGIIHPKVIKKTLEIHSSVKSFTVIDAPLLIESGMHKLCNQVWLVTATEESRLQRIMARDNIDRAAALTRFANRKGEDFLRPFATLIIENNGDRETLIKHVQNILEGVIT